MCSQPMAGVTVAVGGPGSPEETLDVCREDEFIWFDPGELDEFPQHTAAAPPSADELREDRPDPRDVRPRPRRGGRPKRSSQRRPRPVREPRRHVAPGLRPPARPRRLQARAGRHGRAAARRLGRPRRRRLQPCRPAADRRLPVRRRPLRGDRAARLRQLLPLHALPAAHRHRGLGLGADRPRIAADRSPARSSCARTSRPTGFAKDFCSACGSALWSRDPNNPNVISVRLGAFDADPGDPALLPPVRRLRRAVGADPGRRSPPLSRARARPPSAQATRAGGAEEALMPLQTLLRAALPFMAGGAVAIFLAELTRPHEPHAGESFPGTWFGDAGTDARAPLDRRAHVQLGRLAAAAPARRPESHPGRRVL